VLAVDVAEIAVATEDVVAELVKWIGLAEVRVHVELVELVGLVEVRVHMSNIVTVVDTVVVDVDTVVVDVDAVVVVEQETRRSCQHQVSCSWLHTWHSSVSQLNSIGQPRPTKRQHHLFLPSDQVVLQVAKPAVQLSVVSRESFTTVRFDTGLNVVVHPTPRC